LGHGNSSTASLATFEKGGAKPFHRFAYDLWERFCGAKSQIIYRFAYDLWEGANSQIQVHLLESFGKFWLRNASPFGPFSKGG
jgi:hypothetical protein